MQAPEQVTALLNRMRGGDLEAREHLFAVVYDQLRALAGQYLGRTSEPHTLQPTALVNEAYLRLFADVGASYEGRAHFLGVAARAMRSVLVDHARSRGARKRGDGQRALPLDQVVVAFEDKSTDLIALDEALAKLASVSQTAARVVELRFFGGLTNAETARVIEVSESTVEREWVTARAWLYRSLAGPGA
jgi:RNA polymerase sigma-70 factor, ECF subfamily